jgi:hypothetical protein
MLKMNRKRLSRVIWETILDHTTSHAKIPWVEQLNMLNALIPTAQAPTGSINLANFWCLYSVAQLFKPKRVAEVGTYIGKSTLALVASGAEVHTCDYSNDIKLPFKVTQYPMTSSTQMFAQLQPEIDLLFLDGRLEKDDLPHIGRLLHSRSIVALDDFEGLEKGVANAQRFTYDGAILVYPAEKELLEKHGLPDESTLALILPHTVVQLTNQ